MRAYLLRVFRRVIGSYGASDLAVNMAIETELWIRLRQAILVDERLHWVADPR